MFTRIVLFGLVSWGLIAGSSIQEAHAKPRARAGHLAPIKGLAAIKLGVRTISPEKIRVAAMDCLQNHLAKIKPRMHTTVAEWNGIDTKSVELQSVKLTPARIGFSDRYLGSNEVRFVAQYSVKMGREKKERKTLYLCSDINLAESLSLTEPRTRRPQHYGGVSTQPPSVGGTLASIAGTID